ncbi:MAG: hypothetical protein ACJ735_03625 [Actinomycetes bacterium]
MRRLRLLALLVVLAAAGTTVAVIAVHSSHTITPGCTVTIGTESYDLDLEQASNAATIAAVGTRMGLPDHAVTVAYAAAFQESKLLNLPFGDRDSVGLFQQRPSQGWGTPAQLLDPSYAAHAFYAKLTTISGWRTMPIAAAAQKVQRSASGAAYEQWEPEGRTLARALTGEVPAAFTCQFADPKRPAATTLSADAARAFGRPVIGTTLTKQQCWAAASWIVANAHDYGVKSVTVDGRTWTNKSTQWRASRPAAPVVQITRFPQK